MSAAEQHEDLMDLARRALAHQQNHTTDMTEAVMSMPVDAYTDPGRYQAERTRIFKTLPLAMALTIELPDLMEMIHRVQPKLVIPMHYRIPGPKFFMLPVTEFTGHYPDDMITWSDSPTLTITHDTLPAATQIHVLKPTLFREE